MLQLLFSSCLFHRSVTVKSCQVGKNAIMIKLKCVNFYPDITKVMIYGDINTAEPNRLYHAFFEEDMCCRTSDGEMEITVNCSKEKIETNQEYRLSLSFPGGFAMAKVFFGNTEEKVSKYYPCDDYEKLQISILKTSYVIGM